MYRGAYISTYIYFHKAYLARVVLHNMAQHVVGQLHLRCWQPMLLEQLGDEVALGNVHLSTMM